MDTKARAEVNGLAVASLIFGIISILTCWTVILPVPLVLLTFMFALLSRGNKKESGVAVAGMVLGVVGLAFTLVVIVSVLVWLWQLYSNVKAVLDTVYNYVMSIVNSIYSFFYGIYTYFDNLVRSFETIGAFFEDTVTFFENLGSGLKGGLF